MNYQVKSAVLLIVFRRPDTTSRVLEEIRKARPQKLYVAQNCPSTQSETERVNWNKVRNLVENIDWDCEVTKLYRTEHLSAKDSISSAITWFFNNVGEGIIIEDDVLPSADFFRFCDYALNQYRHDTRIGMVTGNNLLGAGVHSNGYIYSQLTSAWGWATWRRAWDTYQPVLNDWPSKWRKDSLRHRFNRTLELYFTHTFDTYLSEKIDTWDIQWLYTCLFNNFLTVTPNANMISNIGIVGAHSISETPNHNVGYGTVSCRDFEGPMAVVPDPYFDKEFARLKLRPELRINMISRLTKKLWIHSVAQSFYILFKKFASKKNDSR